MKRRFVKYLFIAAAATASMILPMNAAHAETWQVDSPDGGALIQFDDYGERFMITDFLCDGLVPRLQYRWNVQSPIYTHEFYGGCGEFEIFDRDWRDGAVFEFRTCNVGSGQSSTPCSVWVRAVA